MKRTPMKPGQPMKRSGFKRKAAKPGRSNIKATRPKTSPIRASARGEECTLKIPGVCNYNPETTVWAHSNQAKHGKGMGLKAADEYGCYACSSCHTFLDHGWANHPMIESYHVEFMFEIAMQKSRDKLRQKGLLK